ncbi:MULTISPECIES: MFS transporter [unclassified Methanoculleus]|jgi:EmrB/QacA subfamily drug resistance transporter|uniref:MFS transporter n=4 Tax=Methanoculleus TaxID=45989 RepID=UPI00319E92B6
MKTGIHSPHAPTTSDAARNIVMVVALLGMYMTVLDSVVITIALPTITAAFHADIALSQWTITGYLVAMTASMLVFARMAAYFGKNRIFLAGIGLFTIASLGCALAPTLPVLIGMRILQGLGAAMAAALVMVIVFELYPADGQGKAMGILGGTIALASVTGPCIGGVLLDLAGWPAIFLINIPIGILLVTLGIQSMDVKKPVLTHRFVMDWTGAATFTVMVTSFMVFLSLIAGDTVDGIPVAMIGVTCCASIIAFIRTERRHPQPLLNFAILGRQAFTRPLFAMVAFFCALFVVEVSLPFYLEDVWGFSAMQVGQVFMLIAGILTVGSPLVGRLYDRNPRSHYTIAGLGVAATGLVAFALFADSMNLPLILGALVVFTLGFTLFQSPVNTEIMRGLPVQQAAIASGLSNTGRHFAMTAGTSIAALIFSIHLHVAGGTGGTDAAQITGSTTTAMLTAAVLCLVGIVLRVSEPKNTPDDLTETCTAD